MAVVLSICAIALTLAVVALVVNRIVLSRQNGICRDQGHSMKHFKTIDVYNVDYQDSYPVKTKYCQQCERCGKVTTTIL